MSRMIFVTGFARGGTSWLRDCIADHPDVQKIPREMPIFREFHAVPDSIRGAVAKAVAENGLTGPYVVNKAPANAPFVGKVARNLPESKFVFIIRDPRDVFVSHKRGTKEWMGGQNSTVDGCMRKIRAYYDGYEEARSLPNVHLVRYEDLHQDFCQTLRGVFDFLGLSSDNDVLDRIFDRQNFVAAAGRQTEDRDSAQRKGVVGDWVNFLEPNESEWYKRDGYWTGFLNRHRYSWVPLTFESVLRAMTDAGVQGLTEQDFLGCRLPTPGPGLALLHDIDLLKTEAQRESVLETARIEGRIGLPALFNFLPLDDVRYAPLTPDQVISLIDEVRRLNPQAIIGLHLNATEPFFPPGAPSVGNDHPDVAKAIDYLHRQIDEYETRGVRFRLGTSHGYGRAKKLPNNRDTPVFTAELEKRGIKLWDTVIRSALQTGLECVVALSDVGDPIAMRGFPHSGAIDDADSYRALPSSSLVRFLTHPGNYDIRRPLTLGVRQNSSRAA